MTKYLIAVEKPQVYKVLFYLPNSFFEIAQYMNVFLFFFSYSPKALLLMYYIQISLPPPLKLHNKESCIALATQLSSKVSTPTLATEIMPLNGTVPTTSIIRSTAFGSTDIGLFTDRHSVRAVVAAEAVEQQNSHNEGAGFQLRHWLGDTTNALTTAMHDGKHGALGSYQ